MAADKNKPKCRKPRKNSFFNRVAILAESAIKHSRSEIEREEAAQVRALMAEKQKSA